MEKVMASLNPERLEVCPNIVHGMRWVRLIAAGGRRRFPDLGKYESHAGRG